MEDSSKATGSRIISSQQLARRYPIDRKFK